MKSIKSILVGALVVLALVVVLQNTESVETKLLFATLVMPLALLLLVTLLVGVAIGVVLGMKWARKSRTSAS